MGSGCNVTKVATGSLSSGRASSPTRARPSAVCSAMSRRRAGRTVLARILCWPVLFISSTPSSSGPLRCAPATSGPAGSVPMPAVVQAAHAFGRPGHDMRYARRQLLLAARTPVGLGRTGATDPADEPFAVAVGLTAFDPTDGSVEVELGDLKTSTMGSGHATTIAGTGARRRCGTHAPPCDRGSGR